MIETPENTAYDEDGFAYPVPEEAKGVLYGRISIDPAVVDPNRFRELLDDELAALRYDMIQAYDEVIRAAHS